MTSDPRKIFTWRGRRRPSASKDDIDWQVHSRSTEENCPIISHQTLLSKLPRHQQLCGLKYFFPSIVTEKNRWLPVLKRETRQPGCHMDWPSARSWFLQGTREIFWKSCQGVSVDSEKKTGMDVFFSTWNCFMMIFSLFGLNPGKNIMIWEWKKEPFEFRVVLTFRHSNFIFAKFCQLWLCWFSDVKCNLGRG